MKYYLDCEFCQFTENLISIALVGDLNKEIYIVVKDPVINDPWLTDNVMNILFATTPPKTIQTTKDGVGMFLRDFLLFDDDIVLVCDSPIDIAYFVRAYNRKENGSYHPTGKQRMTFIYENAKPYPTTLEGLVQHNAYSDAKALRHKLKGLSNG